MTNIALTLYNNVAKLFLEYYFILFWLLDLLEAIQGIAFRQRRQVMNLLPFAQILEYFIILWFRTSLDMFTYDFKIDMFKNCINSYHIESKQV